MRLLACVALLWGIAAGASTPWRVAGSDFLESVFAGLGSQAPIPEGDVVEWSFPGSSPAMVALREGRAGLAMVAFPPGQVPSSDLYAVVPLASQVAVVVVHANNPLQEITIEQLRWAFGSSGGVTQWGAFGLRGAWESRSVSSQVFDRSDHLAAEIFRATVLRQDGWRSGVVVSSTVDPVYLRLQEDLGVLAILPTAPPAGRGKVLAVSDNRPGYAFSPTMENVALGDYPLSLAFHVIVRHGDVERWRPWLRWLASDAVAEALASSGYVPVPPATRRQKIMELDLRR